jgi:hypothetical protein
MIVMANDAPLGVCVRRARGQCRARERRRDGRPRRVRPPFVFAEATSFARVWVFARFVTPRFLSV